MAEPVEMSLQAAATFVLAQAALFGVSGAVIASIRRLPRWVRVMGAVLTLAQWALMWPLIEMSFHVLF